MKNIWFINQYITSPEIKGEGYRHYYIAKYFNSETDLKPLLITGSFSHAPKRHNSFLGLYKYVHNGVPTLILKTNKYKQSGGIGRILNWIMFMLNLFLLPVLSKKKVPKPDVIVLSSLPILPIINLAFFRLIYPKTKLVFEIRDLWPLSAIEFGGYKKDNIFIQFIARLEKWAYSNCDLIISVLPRADKHIQKVLGHSNFKYEWITNGYSLSEDNPDLNLKDVLAIDFNESDFKIGYAGTLVVANPLDTVINVVGNFGDNRLKLYILGDGPEKERLMKVAKPFDNIYFLDKIPKGYVSQFLKKMDLLFMGKGRKNSKVYQYGTSQLKTFDYFYAKKPILQALDSLENPVTYAGAGFVVEPENEKELKERISYFMGLNQEELKDFGMKGYDYLMKNCTYKSINLRYQKVINDLVGQPSQKGT
ncbi:glycosyltransferase family 4 protein [Flagellimonas aequoris]|uniref:Glycosyltransferase WbuB n=1 Tax=Flagellimonas aequoris TaxID=2306997 RepID=A0A418N9K1_9FLAO|nr:glycosyltransferase family 4 protein [Allomuricauda aequoris]RIV72553.1 glycosyltransferase WbuB [Allomuricauda aequoris]TXK05054.1 glycosyltransferase family 4 protein [Allomuricauda aequoris]